jgi:hypothetical protein
MVKTRLEELDMGFFDLFKSKPEPPADAPSPIETLLVMNYKHSKGFKGFKRIRLATYKDNVAQRNIKKLLDQEISDVTLTVKVDHINFTEPSRFMDVMADGLHIGTDYPYDDDPYIDMVLSGSIDAVHLRLEDAGDRYNSTLFVHIKEK